MRAGALLTVSTASFFAPAPRAGHAERCKHRGPATGFAAPWRFPQSIAERHRTALGRRWTFESIFNFDTASYRGGGRGGMRMEKYLRCARRSGFAIPSWARSSVGPRNQCSVARVTIVAVAGRQPDRRQTDHPAIVATVERVAGVRGRMDDSSRARHGDSLGSHQGNALQFL
jgi:hypothetical protein